MTYEEALAYVTSLEPRGWRLGLDRMQAFVNEAGLLVDPPCFIHVAGTNGKGSVTAFLQSMLVEHGFRTGAFFSPYVVDPRERVQFGREMISKQDFAKVVGHLKPIAENFTKSEFGGITEFEFKTALGLEYWKQKSCEWVALEVGLGGRLDATNVVQPRCSVIVSIGLDHTHILGETLELIAFEKAGIIKPGTPVVVGQMDPRALDVILRVADEQHAPVWQVGKDVVYQRVEQGVSVASTNGEIVVQPSLVGPIQAHNAAVAVAAMQLSVDDPDPEALKRGASRACVPGRFQTISVGGKKVILDGAHNADAAKVLSQSLKEESSDKLVAIVGMTQGHDPRLFLEQIQGVVSRLYVVPIDFHRTQSVETIAQAASLVGIDAQECDTLSKALHDALIESDNVLVTGSFYLVGEAIRLLQSA